jgi:hypothetical protein
VNDSAAVNTLCILRLSALGDATHVLPLIRTLQKNLPDCRITWILGKAEARLMEGLDGVELIAFDKQAGLAGVKALARALNGRRFDVLLQMQLALRVASDMTHGARRKATACSSTSASGTTNTGSWMSSACSPNRWVSGRPKWSGTFRCRKRIANGRAGNGRTASRCC